MASRQPTDIIPQLWGESYHGDPETVSYEEQANASIAHQLEGKLLLAYGALDDNVPPALTLARTVVSAGHGDLAHVAVAEG